MTFLHPGRSTGAVIEQLCRPISVGEYPSDYLSGSTNMQRERFLDELTLEWVRRTIEGGRFRSRLPSQSC
jgi:hypothetical protein